MITNYLVETDLEGYVPELDDYLFHGETNWSKQKEKAEQIVISDFINKGYKVRLLRPELYLDTTESIEDETGNRIRGVIVSSLTATASVTISGSNDDVTFVTVTTQTASASGTTTFLLTTAYKFYKYTCASSLDDVYLVETNYDLFFAYKWLELILINAGKGKDNKFTQYAEYYRQKYDDLWNNANFYYDKDDSGDLATEEMQQGSLERIIH